MIPIETTELIREMGVEFESSIIAMRRYFHRFPELSGKEFETSSYICDELDELGVEYERIWGAHDSELRSKSGQYFGTGIIATIRGTAPGAYDEAGNPARRIALRTDIDALAVLEQTGADYASENEGIMHACGHDCHMAMMLGAVRMLVRLRDRLRGEVRVIFDGEEHTLTRSSLIFFPPNLPHAIRILRVDKPIFHFSVVTESEYNGGAYTK